MVSRENHGYGLASARRFVSLVPAQPLSVILRSRAEALDKFSVFKSKRLEASCQFFNCFYTHTHLLDPPSIKGVFQGTSTCHQRSIKIVFQVTSTCFKYSVKAVFQVTSTCHQRSIMSVFHVTSTCFHHSIKAVLQATSTCHRSLIDTVFEDFQVTPHVSNIPSGASSTLIQHVNLIASRAFSKLLQHVINVAY